MLLDLSLVLARGYVKSKPPALVLGRDSFSQTHVLDTYNVPGTVLGIRTIKTRYSPQAGVAPVGESDA